MRASRIEHQFVEEIPRQIQGGILYISTTYATAMHRCACGCGAEVVTPLSPTDWSLIFDGETVSLTPSIGNWAFPCRSHYWIDRGEVVWAGDMSDRAIELGRARNRKVKAVYYDIKVHATPPAAAYAAGQTPQPHQETAPPRRSLLKLFARLLGMGKAGE